MAATQGTFFPISELSTYHSKWTIRARVTSKAQIRTFRNGDGKVFSVELLDAEGGEIRASFFNDAVTKFHDKLQKGKCYTFSGGSVRVANRQFNQCSHRYELSFDKACQIEEVGEVTQIQTNVFKVTDLRAVQSKTLPCSTDLCGVIVSFQPKHSFTSKAGQELVKREITVADDTATSMVVTLWGDRAKQEDSAFAGNPLVVLKGVWIKEWNGGRSGSLQQESGDLVFDSQLPEAQRVRQWWSEGGSSKEIKALSVTGAGGRGPSGAAVEDLGDLRRQSEQVLGDQAKVFSVFARLSQVQMRKQGEPQPLTYMACVEPKEGNGLPCNRRVDESGFCAACNRAGKAAPRLMLRCKFSDFADSPWLTTFHEAAAKVVGLSAEQVKALEDGEGREAAEAAVRKAYLQEPVQLIVRAKLDSYNGEVRTNVTCIDARPVSLGERGRAMLGEISEMVAVKA
jgi:replication factor A1